MKKNLSAQHYLYRLAGIAVIAIALLLTGCKDNNPADTGEEEEEQQEETDPNTSSVEVGSGGGTVTSTDNLITIEIPAGALGATETITITVIEPDELGPEFDEIANEIGIDKAYELGPDGLEFDQPVSVSFASDQTVVQQGDSVEIAPAALLTSDGDQAVGLDSLRMVMDEETGAVTLAGELSHFSPLVKTIEVQRADTIVSFKVFGVPDELEVNDTFTAVAHYVSWPISHEHASYQDFSMLPVKPFDFGRGDQSLAEANSGKEDEYLSKGSFRYTCEEVGTGIFIATAVATVTLPGSNGRIFVEDWPVNAPWLRPRSQAAAVPRAIPGM